MRPAPIRSSTGVHRVGWGLLPILALAGLRFVLRAEAWRLCTPVNSRLPLRQAFVAFLAGDALGNITPLGLIASEPTKVFLTRQQLATSESVASLAIDNLVYALSVVTMIAAGLMVMLLTVPLPFEAQEWGLRHARGAGGDRRRQPARCFRRDAAHRAGVRRQLARAACRACASR